MEFAEVVKKRRAVRDFTSAGIERPEIEALINNAIEAPSAMNLQPWAFAVVLDHARIDDYARRAKEWLLASPTRMLPRPPPARCLRIRTSPSFTTLPRFCWCWPGLLKRKRLRTAAWPRRT